MRRTASPLSAAVCRRTFALLPLSLLACFNTASAQYRLDHWTAETGLPQNSVRDLVQTRDGYLWITTLGGLARFDGKRLTVFTKVTQPEIPSNRFTFLHEDRAGHLWIGTQESGVLRYRDGAFTGWTAKDGLPGNHVAHIDEDEAGAILIFTDQGAAQWRDGKFTKLPLTQTIAKGSAGAQLDGYRQYLSFALRPAVTGYQLFNRGRWEHLPNPPGVPAGVFFLPAGGRPPLMEDTRGRLWFHWHNVSGYYERRGGQWEATLTSPVLGIPFYLDQQGRYWTVYKAGVALEKDGKATPLPLQGVDWAYRVLEDREGNLWLGTYDQGLFRLIEQAVSFLALPGRPTERYVYPLLEDRLGNVWISAGEAGLTRYANGRLTRFPLPGASRSRDISSFYEDRDGSLLVGTFLYGMTRFRNGEWRKDPELSARIKGRVDVIFRDRRGDLWFGGQNGLDRQSIAGQWTHYGPDNGLPTEHVKTMLEDSSGRLWVGGYGCLALWHNGRFTAWTKNEGLIADRVISLYEDSERVLWAGTSDGGLYRFQPAGAAWHLTRYTTRDGLHSDAVKQIFEDERGYFWIGSEQGIFRLHKQELNNFAAGRQTLITSTPFGKADGMLSAECIGGFQPAGFKARDGRLWFPTQEGVAIVDPRRVPTNSIPPPVALEECLLDRRPVDWRKGVQINPGQASLEISYTGLSFDKAEKVRFRYRLEGLEPDWIEAGTRRTAYYSHLPPGSYTFKVIAANSDGVWNTEGRSLAIEVLPPFYRTWWFMSLAAVSLIAAVLLLYRHRIALLRREHVRQQAFSRQLIDSQERERKRIAAELHDSLGQQLLIVKNRALLGLLQPDDAARAVAELHEISTTVSQSLDEVRQIAAGLHPYQLDRLGLTKAIEAMTRKVAAAAGINITAEIDNVDDLFDAPAEINLYRIVQESLNNIVKHSGADAAGVAIKRADGSVTVAVHDNGKGFAAGDQKSGFGLTGIAERVSMLGGAHAVDSSPGKGTTLTLTIGLNNGHQLSTKAKVKR